MIERINNNQMPDMGKESSSPKSKPAAGSINNAADASLEVSYASLIEKAKSPQPENIDAVERAKQLLMSGQLDSPENIRATAEKIIEFGI
ncbi:MAG: hypothetical protein K8R02_04445 [Anaerohalosphaeraceae bacterium]|nr:hypothetical protein [Anaerohalosphaeraceae bacterium]